MDPNDPFRSTFWVRVGVAVLCGSLLGIERQLRGKPAGIRTSVLVCLGTMTYIQLGSALVPAEHADPSRVLGQVITGIGFLGAGVILTHGGLVLGVTSGAVIWIIAAIGAAIGFGYLASAVALTAVTLFILTGVQILERRVRRLRRGVHSDPAQNSGASSAP